MTNIKIAKWDAFYKYGTFSVMERIKPMICENKFYFASPSQLNDPSDCRNKVQDQSEEEIEKFLIQANKKFYGDQRSDADIKEGINNYGAATLLEEMSTQFNKLMDTRYGVFSLTKRPDNMALWAKYADDHKGYCLEFSNLSQSSYVYEVLYSEKFPHSLNMELDPSQADFLYTKSPEWSNEEEARILSKPGLQILSNNPLKSIILGERCEQEKEKTIIDWIKECNEGINIKKATFNNARQKLEFLKVS